MALTDEQFQALKNNLQKQKDELGEQEYQSFVSGVKQTNTTPLKTTSQVTQENLGTGFNPSFESQADDSVIKSVAKTVGNTPKSLYMLGKDVVTAVANPIDTAKAVGGLIKGTGGKIAEAGLEKTSFGQTLLEKMNEGRIARGLPELQRDASGKLQAQNTQEVELVNNLGKYVDARYGTWDNFKASAVEDPAGVLSDIATFASGVGFGVKQAGNLSRVNRVSQAGQVIQRAGDALEPVTAITRSTGAVANTLGNTTPGRIISEASPTPGRFVEGQVVKALDLTQGDVSRISQTTGNNVSDFITRNKLFRETPEEIALALDDFKGQQYTAVRDAVGQVGTTYNAGDVPRVQSALQTVQNTINDVPGLEDVASEVNRLLNQDTYTLSDVQRVKEILDKNTNIYNRLGDAKQTATAQGLDNIRKELRSFIEDEVSKATDGQVDIRALNNDVATSVELMNAIEARATRFATRQYNSVFDGILGFSAYAATGDPLTAVGIVVTKKLAETPSFRIALARTLSGQQAKDVARWADEIANNNISPQTRQSLLQIIEEAKKNAEYIEAGAQIIDETNEAMENQDQLERQ